MQDGPLGIPDDCVERLISTLEDAAEQKKQEALKALDVQDLRSSFNTHIKHNSTKIATAQTTQTSLSPSKKPISLSLDPKVAAAQVSLMAGLEPLSPKEWEEVANT
jgi:hypothetical protein